MRSLSLEDIGLFKLISERKSKNAKIYSGILIPIANDTDGLLQYIKKEYPSYPDHGIQHSFRILNYLSCLLDENTKNSISDTELFCLIMSALFHDTGMTLFNHNDIKNLRRDHHELSGIVLDKYFEEKLQIIPQRERLRKIISFVCYSHGISQQDLYTDERFNKKDTIENDVVRYFLLSILLRIGDLMDLEAGRSNEFVLSLFRSTYPIDALNHNIRHTLVETYVYNEKELIIEVFAEKFEQHKIWATWFDFLKNDILHANSKLHDYSVFFPVPKTFIRNPPNVDFEVEPLRFEIDEKGGIWNILAQSIYTDEFDFIRELIQNAIDATLLNIYLDSRIHLKNMSPRSWNTNKNCPPVLIGYSEKRKMLLVIDSGVGMNKDDLKKFLFKVSSSGHSEFEKREFEFPSIAKFGIGFVSCLINARTIEIFTKKKEESKVNHVSLESVLNMAFLQSVQMNAQSGTTIKLHLKHSFTYSSVESYIKNVFKYPSVRIKCLNIDSLENVINNLDLSISFNELLDNPFQFYHHIDSIETKHDEVTNPIDQLIRSLRSAYDKIVALEKWIDNHLDRVAYKKNKVILKQNDYISFLKKLKVVNVLIESMDGRIPSSPLKNDAVDEKTFFDSPGKYVHILTQYSSDLKKKTDEQDNLRKRFLYETTSIGNLTVSAFRNSKTEWKYCVLFIGNNLKITNIKYLKNPIDLSYKRGIIFFYHENANFQDGVEYASINGLLFNRGKICNTLARFSKKYDDDEYDENEYENEYENEHENEYENEYDEEEFDVLYIQNNKLLFSNNITSSSDEDEDEVEINFVDKYAINIFDSYSGYGYVTSESLWHKSLAEKRYEIESLIQENEDSVFCQDGIRLSLNLNALFPIGIFKVVCNLTANSRMALNVTRHKLSENRTDIDNWMYKTGRNLQSQLLDKVVEMTKSMKLELNIEKLQHNVVDHNGYFSQSAIQQFRKIFMEMEANFS